MQLHPYLAAKECAFTRLVRAHFWFIADMDFRNAQYWRDQIQECERLFLNQSVGGPNVLETVQERRRKLVQEQLGVAMRTGYQMATKRWHRGGTDVPH